MAYFINIKFLKNMENEKLETLPGDNFNGVAKKAKYIASDVLYVNTIVEFDFNGCICLVNASTNLDFLYRDYRNHFIMEWKQIGPNCEEEYSDDIKNELENKQKISDEKAQLEAKKHFEEEAENRAKFIAKTKNIEQKQKT